VISMETKKLIAICMIAILLGAICIGLGAAIRTIQEKDAVAEKAINALDADSSNEQLKREYNAAAREYIGATAYFPGTLLGRIFGFPPDKWPILKEPRGYTSWAPLPGSYPLDILVIES